MPGSLTRPPVLLERRRRGPGQPGSQRRLLRAGPWLLCLGRRRQRRRQRPDAYGHHRPRQRALAGRARQQPAAAMASSALCSAPGHSAAAAVRSPPCACARRAPPPLLLRARPRSLTIARVRGFPRRLRYVGGGDQPAAAGTARLRRLWKRVPRRLLPAHCDTRHSDTRALSHSPLTRSHPHSPAGPTWESRRGRSSPGAVAVAMMPECVLSPSGTGLGCPRHGVRDHVCDGSAVPGAGRVFRKPLLNK